MWPMPGAGSRTIVSTIFYFGFSGFVFGFVFDNVIDK
jgi:hypothetical protein